MSLTPDSTADNAMNSALNASAINRASVVLPTPGGPHRIIECSLPDAKATASGLPGASRCRWPITSAIVCGRSRSASGAVAAACAGVAKRSVKLKGRMVAMEADAAGPALRLPARIMRGRVRPCTLPAQHRRRATALQDVPPTSRQRPVHACVTIPSKPGLRPAAAYAAPWCSSSSRRGCRRSAKTPAPSSCSTTWSTPASRSRR